MESSRKSPNDDVLSRAVALEEWGKVRRLLKPLCPEDDGDDDGAFDNTTDMEADERQSVERMVHFESPYTGETPLHRACYVDAPMDVLECLLVAHSGACLVKNKFHGSLPLHRACRRLPNDEKLLLLLRACPDAARVSTKRGDMPLHLAVWERRSSQVVQAILAAFPEACLMQNSGAVATPLHLACDRSFTDETILLLLSACPAAASLRNKRGECPLHVALLRNRSSVVIRSLLDASQDAVQVSYHRRRSTNAPTLMAFDYLVSNHSALVQDFMRKGQVFPVDTSRMLCADTTYPTEERGNRLAFIADVTELLLRAFSYDHSFQRGDTNVHPFLVLHASIEAPMLPRWFTYLILRRHPEHARMVDGSGNLPLHLLCASMVRRRKGGDDLMFDFLFKAHPNGLSARNHKGWTPLQNTVMNLLARNTFVTRHVPKDGKIVAVGEDHPNNCDVVFRLLLLDPCVLRSP